MYLLYQDAPFSTALCYRSPLPCATSRPGRSSQGLPISPSSRLPSRQQPSLPPSLVVKSSPSLTLPPFNLPPSLSRAHPSPPFLPSSPSHLRLLAPSPLLPPSLSTSLLPHPPDFPFLPPSLRPSLHFLLPSNLPLPLPPSLPPSAPGLGAALCSPPGLGTAQSQPVQLRLNAALTPRHRDTAGTWTWLREF